MLLENPILLQYRKLRASEIENNTDLVFLSGIPETGVSHPNWPVYCSHVEVPNGMFVCVSGLSPEDPEDFGFLEKIWQNKEEEQEIEIMRGSIEHIKSTVEHIFLYAFVVAKLKQKTEEEFETRIKFIDSPSEDIENCKISRLENLPNLQNQNFTLQYSAADHPEIEHDKQIDSPMEIPLDGNRLIDAQMLISAFPCLNEAECSSLIFVLNTTPAQSVEEKDGPTINTLRSVRKFPLSYRILEIVEEARQELLKHRDLLFENDISGPGLMTKDLIRDLFKKNHLQRYSELFRCLVPEKDQYNRISFENLRSWIQSDPLVMLPNFTGLVDELRNSDERDHLQLSESLNWDVRWRRTTRKDLFQWIDEILASIISDIVHVAVKQNKDLLKDPVNTTLQFKVKELSEIFSTKLILEENSQVEENLLYWTEKWVKKGPRMLALSTSLRESTSKVGVVITWPMFSNEDNPPPAMIFARLRFLTELSEYIQLFYEASNIMLDHAVIGRRDEALKNKNRPPKENPINFTKFIRLITRTSLYEKDINDKVLNKLESLHNEGRPYDDVIALLFEKSRADIRGDVLYDEIF
eukprot:GHVP01053643.1.p1 GENE.GHVP01053643.1~~GHVP01053643.1.p1  ORF type:complete len:581 (+),score=108.93 GHVP01053643.1:1013-2755(+)